MSVGLYKKHLIFWTLIGLCLWVSVSIYHGQISQADISLPSQTTTNSNPDVSYTLTVNPDTTVSNNNQHVARLFTPLADIDRLQIPIIDKPPQTIASLSVNIILPPNTTLDAVNIIPQLVHTTNPTMTKNIIDNRTVIYSASYLDPSAQLAFELDFPKGILQLPLNERVTQFVLNKTLIWWLALAILLPLLSFIFLSIAIFRRYQLTKLSRNLKPIAQPPDNLPPAAVEALVAGHLSKRAIAATLIDLAQRNYIVVSRRGEENFRIGKLKAFTLPSQAQLAGTTDKNEVQTILRAVAAVHDNTDLKLFERLLLSKIFTSNQPIANRETIEHRIGHRLFSEKIAQFYAEVYSIATQHGYFIENPAAYHRNYKTIGIILFLIGFTGFVIGAKYFIDPKTVLFFWVGMILSSLIIITLAPKLPVLSTTGKKAYREWMAFRAYLSNPQPLPYQQNEALFFERFLPYAIAMGCEKEWTARFRQHPFVTPNWFVSEVDYPTIDQFDIELLPLIIWLGKIFSFARTPVID